MGRRIAGYKHCSELTIALFALASLAILRACAKWCTILSAWSTPEFGWAGTWQKREVAAAAVSLEMFLRDGW
jgi:hypothetical protein